MKEFEEKTHFNENETNDTNSIQFKHEQNIETLNDYSCLLRDFLEELGDDQKIIENEEETICKADVLFFAKELQWRFEEIKDQFMLNMKKEKQTNLDEKTNKIRLHDKNNSKVLNRSQNDIGKSSFSEIDRGINCTKNELKTKPLLPIQAQILHGQIHQLQKETMEKDKTIENLRISCESLQNEMAQMKDREETHRLQILYAQSRLKYLEIAVNTNIRKQQQDKQKQTQQDEIRSPNENVNHDVQSPNHFSSHLKSSSSKFISAIATASVIEKRTDCLQTSDDDYMSNNESHRNEEKSNDYDFESPIVEEMRKQIIKLAESLEKSEREKEDLLERSKQEKNEYAKWFQSMGEQVKLAILNSEYPISVNDEHHDLD